MRTYREHIAAKVKAFSALDLDMPTRSRPRLLRRTRAQPCLRALVRVKDGAPARPPSGRRSRSLRRAGARRIMRMWGRGDRTSVPALRENGRRDCPADGLQPRRHAKHGAGHRRESDPPSHRHDPGRFRCRLSTQLQNRAGLEARRQTPQRPSEGQFVFRAFTAPAYVCMQP